MSSLFSLLFLFLNKILKMPRRMYNSKKIAVEKKAEEKMGHEKNGRLKRPKEKKKNNVNSNFSTTANIFMRDFFYTY